MASNLFWRPVNHDGECFAYELKFSLAERVWGHDGSSNSDWTEVGDNLIPFLEGVIAGAPPKSDRGKEAKELIKLIRKHGSVELALKS